MSSGQAGSMLSPAEVAGLAALLPSDLNLLTVDEVDSTNRLARSLIDRLREERVPVSVAIADRQSAGRGRGQRSWQSESGAGVWATWMGAVDSERLEVLPSRIGVELCSAVQDLGVGGVRLKWPNDVYWGGRKLAGVLCGSLLRHGQTVALCGIGVNLTRPARDLASIAVGLQEAGFSGDWSEALVACLTAVDRAARGVRSDWHRLLRRYSLHQVGDSLTWHDGGVARHGRFLGFTDAGRLRLDLNGDQRELASGDID